MVIKGLNMKKIKTLLVANRGEIASRVFASCRELGIKTVAVFSKYDASLQFVKDADKAVLLEGETLKDTYLSIDKILKIAQEYKVDAIHPGYGFLSENSTFADAVTNRELSLLDQAAKTFMPWAIKVHQKFFYSP